MVGRALSWQRPQLGFSASRAASRSGDEVLRRGRGRAASLRRGPGPLRRGGRRAWSPGPAPGLRVPHDGGEATPRVARRQSGRRWGKPRLVTQPPEERDQRRKRRRRRGGGASAVGPGCCSRSSGTSRTSSPSAASSSSRCSSSWRTRRAPWPRCSPGRCFAVAAITDVVDGWLARRMGLVDGHRQVPRSARRQADRPRGDGDAGAAGALPGVGGHPPALARVRRHRAPADRGERGDGHRRGPGGEVEDRAPAGGDHRPAACTTSTRWTCGCGTAR